MRRWVEFRWLFEHWDLGRYGRLRLGWCLVRCISNCLTLDGPPDSPSLWEQEAWNGVRHCLLYSVKSEVAK
jgi:hypothetical protein